MNERTRREGSQAGRKEENYKCVATVIESLLKTS